MMYLVFKNVAAFLALNYISIFKNYLYSQIHTQIGFLTREGSKTENWSRFKRNLSVTRARMCSGVNAIDGGKGTGSAIT